MDAADTQGAPSAHLIESFTNLPGAHCGSIAMRNLIHHYTGLDLSEAMTFGLGSGVDLVLVETEAFEPPVMPFGRSITMELDACAALGIDYREQPELNDERAWHDVKQEVLAGRPTMLSGDIFHLDYREFKYHFPGHRFVLVGFDDTRRVALIGDRIAAELQECSYKALAASRNPSEGFSTYNLWGKFYDTKVTKTLEEACADALSKAARRMLGTDTTQGDIVRMLTANTKVRVTTGLAGIEAYARQLESWSHREDAAFLASIFSRLIETFGTGGGNFRKLYAGFLQRAAELVPELVPHSAIALALRSAQQWTLLSETFAQAAQRPEEGAHWRQGSEQLREIARIERDLFQSFA